MRCLKHVYNKSLKHFFVYNALANRIVINGVYTSAAIAEYAPNIFNINLKCSFQRLHINFRFVHLG